MTATRPFVSAIIPVYNGEAFLAEAIESIRRQNYHPLELIIVDDGSTDATREIASGCTGDIRYLYQTNSGPPAARNAGLRVARGDVIGFLDADDLWVNERLALQLARLADHPWVDIVLGQLQRFRVSSVYATPKYEALGTSEFVLSLSCALFRRSAFERVGSFDETQRYDDDVDWFLRAKEGGISILTHQEVVVLYRRHESNLTNQRSVDNRYFIAALKKSLDRRRKSSG